MNKIFFSATIIFLFFCSCYRTTEIDIPLSEKRLIANCYFSPDESWEVFLSESMPVLDTNQNIKIVTNANVIISEEGGISDTLKFFNNRYLSASKPIVGKYYNLTITTPNFPTLTARDYIPQLPTNIEGRLDKSVVSIDYDALLIPIEFYSVFFSLKDIETEKNYYKTNIYSFDKKYLKKDSIRYDSLFENANIRTNDPVAVNLHKEQPSILMEDKLFNGNTKSIVGLVSRNIFLNIQIDLNKPLESQQRDLELYLEVQTLSENTFLYEKSYISQQFNKVDPFSEPNNVHSNIKNGFGIFGGYQSKRIHIF
jgi:hypothetical protein